MYSRRVDLAGGARESQHEGMSAGFCLLPSCRQAPGHFRLEKFWKLCVQSKGAGACEQFGQRLAASRRCLPLSLLRSSLHEHGHFEGFNVRHGTACESCCDRQAAASEGAYTSYHFRSKLNKRHGTSTQRLLGQLLGPLGQG